MTRPAHAQIYTKLDNQRLFTKRTNMKTILPTGVTLEQHVKKAVYQGGYVWGLSLIANAVSPSPTSWG